MFHSFACNFGKNESFSAYERKYLSTEKYASAFFLCFFFFRAEERETDADVLMGAGMVGGW